MNVLCEYLIITLIDKHVNVKVNSFYWDGNLKFIFMKLYLCKIKEGFC